MKETHRDRLCDLLLFLVFRIVFALARPLAPALLLGSLVEGRQVVERGPKLHLQRERMQIERACGRVECQLTHSLARAANRSRDAPERTEPAM
jgi:hypothetical protein